ncbi:MAG: two-component system sensor protein [uncultured Thiotrichaceae bacterium]|uniref:histidine kinase n=1 Tax=uncultured Thiotrichaceae bacterium TaxID=298394 RepID=A0A6S6TUQ8_9GAMM|nr:MAG: two-component system sensor protein [uncultured Thiotrichaceae bacterium]
MRTSSGINSKLIRVYVLQMLFISVITVLGVFAAALVVEQVMMHKALEREAAHFWARYLVESDHPHHAPDTDNLRGFLAVNGDFSEIPDELQKVKVHKGHPYYGRVEFEGDEPILYVDDREGHRLFLIFDENSVSRLSLYFGVMPLSLALLMIYLSAWFAYRSSQRHLSPMISLAQTMRDFDLSKDDLDSLHLDGYTRVGVDDEVRVLADSLNEFTQRLKLQLQREQEFTRDVSHELRTPLAVIQGSLEMMVRQPLSVPQQRAVKRMNTTSRDMLSLIETLLLLARDSSSGRTKHESLIVNDLVDLLIEQIEVTHNRDQHVTISTEAGDLLAVAAPAQAVGVVLGNLLRNACNYTPDGKVVVVIDKTSVSVRDTGEGIDEQALARVQQPFERGTDQGSGYGLGLDIVRRLCERYRWELSIQSVPGKGTVVRVGFLA